MPGTHSKLSRCVFSFYLHSSLMKYIPTLQMGTLRLRVTKLEIGRFRI